MQVRIQQNGGTYTGYLDEKLSVTDEWKTFEKEFVMAYDNDTAARLCINLALRVRLRKLTRVFLSMISALQ
jgi:hypothetical protein